MRIVIGSDAEGMPLKETVKAYLVELGHEVVDKSEEPAADLVDSTLAVARDLLENPDSLGFAFDRYGDGSYMAACKVKGIHLAILKENSPSCGVHRVHDGLFSGKTIEGLGITAKTLQKNNIAMIDEEEAKELLSLLEEKHA